MRTFNENLNAGFPINKYLFFQRLSKKDNWL
jgi:hypothetical protein